MSQIYNSVADLIGHTPLVELHNIEKSYSLKARLLAKVESVNPAGSVKDRVALNMIEDAERRGLLKKGSTIIEPTSGNTGIGLCAVAAARGYRAIIVMPDTMSQERQLLMRAYGAELVLTDGKLGMSGAIRKAEEIQKSTPDSIIAGQFVNPANPEAHYKTTAPEIWADTDGNIDFFVCGVGTGGTLTGMGRYLKKMNPAVQVVAVEPDESPLLSQGWAGPHQLQGIGANFVPKVLDRALIDEVVPVSAAAAGETARAAAAKDGLLVGISSGAALWAALELSKRPAYAGKTIVVLLPDTGERYLSTWLFA